MMTFASTYINVSKLSMSAIVRHTTSDTSALTRNKCPLSNNSVKIWSLDPTMFHVFTDTDNRSRRQDAQTVTTCRRHV